MVLAAITFYWRPLCLIGESIAMFYNFKNPMPQNIRAKENPVTVTQVKSLTPQQLMMLARQVKSGQLVPATMIQSDDGTRVVRPALQELTQ